MSSCASYVSRTHDIIDDIKRSQSGSNFEIDMSLSIFELERRSKAQNVGNANGYLSGIFNFRYHFRQKSLNWKYIPRTDDPTVKPAWLFQIQRGSGLYDSGPQVIYLTIVLLINRHFLEQWSTIIQITPINFQKHIHDWRHNCGVAMDVLGYQEDRNIILSPRF